MNRALFAAASGMDIEQQNLDTIAANLANADVSAFAGQIVQAHSLLDAQGRVLGAQPAGTELQFRQGRLEKSGGPCDIALRGSGFFVLQRGHDVAYTRSGAFTRNAQGLLENSAGWHLAGIRIPVRADALHVAADGTVSASGLARNNAILGRLKIAQFSAPQKLAVIDAVTFAANSQSGEARLVAAGGDGKPEIEFGTLERSSVSIVESMMEILDAQRAYEADAKGVQAADEMVRIANNLQRG